MPDLERPLTVNGAAVLVRQLARAFLLSVLKICGLPYLAIASSSASRQKSTLMLIDTRCAKTLRVAQSRIATR